MMQSNSNDEKNKNMFLEVPNVLEMFTGPRNNSRPEWPGTPMPPDSMSIPEYKSFEKSEDTIPEDTTGGLPLDDENPDRDSLFFKDCKRRIDLIMVYEEDDIELGVLTEIETLRMETRKQFVKNLEKEGLELELEGKQFSFDLKTYFLKIHVPWNVLTRYAEVMNMKMPIKTFKRLLRADTPPSAGPLIRRPAVHPVIDNRKYE